jgi:hypothetical protein
MFHLIDLEACSAKVQAYADLEGLVPASGDRWQDFQWSHRLIHAFADRTDGDQYWHDFLIHAEAETTHALHDLEDLRWSNLK